MADRLAHRQGASGLEPVGCECHGAGEAAACTAAVLTCMTAKCPTGASLCTTFLCTAFQLAAQCRAAGFSGCTWWRLVTPGLLTSWCHMCRWPLPRHQLESTATTRWQQSPAAHLLGAAARGRQQTRSCLASAATGSCCGPGRPCQATQCRGPRPLLPAQGSAPTLCDAETDMRCLPAQGPPAAAAVTAVLLVADCRQGPRGCNSAQGPQAWVSRRAAAGATAASLPGAI